MTRDEEKVTVRRGQVYCPRCDGRLVATVTVVAHATIHVRRHGRLTGGALVETKAALAAAAAGFDGTLSCEHRCGFTISPDALQDQFRGVAERALATAFADAQVVPATTPANREASR